MGSLQHLPRPIAVFWGGRGREVREMRKKKREWGLTAKFGRRFLLMTVDGLMGCSGVNVD